MSMNYNDVGTQISSQNLAKLAETIPPVFVTKSVSKEARAVRTCWYSHMPPKTINELLVTII
eukprot:106628-Amphidinium_carterae.1